MAPTRVPNVVQLATLPHEPLRVQTLLILHVALAALSWPPFIRFATLRRSRLQVGHSLKAE
eukprot:3230912-Pleurochrysis_carterae.AAC.1